MSILAANTRTVNANPSRHGLRAPKGGCTVNGRTFKGGQFCLPYDVANPHGLPTVEARPEPVRTTINGFVYSVEPARIYPEVGSVAFRMEKVATRNTYDVHRDIYGEVRCDCPDFEFKRAGTGQPCKHGQRLVSLGMIPAPTPRAEAPAPRRGRYVPTPEDFAEACELFRGVAL